MMFGIVLYRNDDTKRWIDEIGFRNQKHLTKVKIHEKFGFCPPHTKLKQRIKMINDKINPLTFYPKYSQLHLKDIKDKLSKTL